MRGTVGGEEVEKGVEGVEFEGLQILVGLIILD